MTKIIALCGASASGKSLLCAALKEHSPNRVHYIATTTQAVRERFSNPTYSYLCSTEGNAIMHTYQTAIAENLWKDLLEAFLLSEEFPYRYDYIILDRSPLDAYIYEELFDAVSKNTSVAHNKTNLTEVALQAVLRLYKEYDIADIKSKYPEVLNIIGLTSLFETNDAKRPNIDINRKYAAEVKRIFNLNLETPHHKTFSLKALPNTRLDIEGRLKLLLNLIQDDSDAN